ncbi:unnamed protein product [Owenia fusiformis]|uniref:G-protein coupled receptors family 1 profile domain-containing protein n=1 Tax=Owenia fusiformis TaxID=6347 RepID=A0A8S4N619_OWEFU|nr:unnamed protein product [Owenia fusiformis]
MMQVQNFSVDTFILDGVGNFTSNMTTLDEGARNLTVVLVEIIVMVVIMVSTIVGNACVCWIIHTHSDLHTLPNKFVLNLAWCDLLTAVVNGPFTISVLIHGDWIMGDVMCQINGFTTTLFGIASVVCLAVISVNRCCMIVYTSKCSSWFTVKTTYMLIIATWVFSAACAFPPMVGWSRYTFIKGKAICTLKWSTEIGYTLLVLIMGVFLPFCVMTISYYKIFNKVRESKRRIALQMDKSMVTNKFSYELSNNASGSSASRKQSSSVARLVPNGTTETVYIPTIKVSSEMDVDVEEEREECDFDNEDMEAPNGSAVKQKLLFVGINNRNGIHLGDKLRKETSMDSYLSSTGSDLAQSDCQQFEWETESAPGELTPRKYSLNSLNSQLSNADSNDSVIPVNKSVQFLKTGDENKKRRGSILSLSLPSPSRTFLALQDKFKRTNFKSDELRITITLLVVCFVFLVCWAPISLVNFVETFWNYRIPEGVDITTVYMVFLQCALNPIIYGVMNRNFRSGFNDIFCCCCDRLKRKESTKMSISRP